MHEITGKVVLCAIRTVGFLLMFAIAWWGAQYVGWSYDDTKVVLGLINGYFPELMLLAGIGGGALVFYRMSKDEEDEFSFSDLFKAGSAYDIYRFGYFWLLIIAGWVVFVSAWRDKEIVALIGVVLGAFVVKGVADSVAGAIGKRRDDANA